MKSLAKAKSLISEKYGFTIIEKPDLGIMPNSYGDKAYTIKGEADMAKGEIIIRSDLEDTMKLITIAHEAGHIINYKEVGMAQFHDNSIKREMRAWLNGLPIAVEMGIYDDYVGYWKGHLDKI